MTQPDVAALVHSVRGKLKGALALVSSIGAELELLPIAIRELEQSVATLDAPAPDDLSDRHGLAGRLALVANLLEAEREAMRAPDRLDIALGLVRSARASLAVPGACAGGTARSSLRSALAESAHALTDAVPLTLEVGDTDALDALPPNRYATTFLDEAVMNAWKHGAGPIAVLLDATDEVVTVEVRDGGAGFDPERVAAGYGLTVLRQCAAALRGQFSVATEPSRVLLSFPSSAAP